jgi:hypothetical protein
MDELDLELAFELEEENRVLAAVGLVRKTELDDDLIAIQSTDWLAECEEINEAVAVEY